jgi:hypothetical protein
LNGDDDVNFNFNCYVTMMHHASLCELFVNTPTAARHEFYCGALLNVRRRRGRRRTSSGQWIAGNAVPPAYRGFLNASRCQSEWVKRLTLQVGPDDPSIQDWLSPRTGRAHWQAGPGIVTTPPSVAVTVVLRPAVSECTGITLLRLWRGSSCSSLPRVTVSDGLSESGFKLGKLAVTHRDWHSGWHWQLEAVTLKYYVDRFNPVTVAWR